MLIRLRHVTRIKLVNYWNNETRHLSKIYGVTTKQLKKKIQKQDVIGSAEIALALAVSNDKQGDHSSEALFGTHRVEKTFSA